MNAIANTVVTRLKAFYDLERISPRGFACSHQEFCTQAAQPGSLRHGAEPYVGSRYGSLLKIVVIDLCRETAPAESESQHAFSESMNEELANPHLKGTLRLLRKLMAKELGDESPLGYFAQIHAAKCSRLEATGTLPDELFGKCRGFCKAELNILEPNLIITHGEPAQRVLDEDFPEREVDVEGLLTPANRITTVPVFDWLTLDWLTTVAARYLSGVRVADHNIYALHTPHPSDSAWQTFEQLHLPICAWLLRELMGNRKR